MSALILTDDNKLFYSQPDGKDSLEVIGASSVSACEESICFRLTLSDGTPATETLNITDEPQIIDALAQLPPAANLPELDLPQDKTLWDPDITPHVFKRHEPIEDGPEEPKLNLNQDAGNYVNNTNTTTTWKDANDVGNTIAVRSSNYGVYVDQAAVELQIKHAFENTPNWSKLKPDARCALDMIATKASRILTGKPDFHDSWHDIQGYAKLVGDRIQRDIEGMGGAI